jgi:hypothetical protein
MHAERAAQELNMLLNRLRAEGVEMRVSAEPMTDLTDLGLRWVFTQNSHHVRKVL